MHIATPTSLCEFGIARADITPPAGIYHRMWGAAVHDRAEGVHQPLTATALFFRKSGADESPANQQVVVALDHCLLGRAEMDAMLDAIQQSTGIPQECVVVTFSHTHGAGLMSLDRVDLPGGDLIPGYLSRVHQTVGDLVRTARREQSPAAITYGLGRCGLAAHRDFWDEGSRQWVCGFNPQGKSDDTVVVARITRPNGQLVATLVNYACHPTTLAFENRLVSPDYPGTTRATIEGVLGAPCVFIQGASGELGPRYGYVGDTAVAEQNGRQLGYAALAAIEGLPPPETRFEFAGPVVSGATLGIWKYLPEGQSRRTACAEWGVARTRLPLRYRNGLPTMEETEAARKQWLADEDAAARAGDDARRRDCRAMAERQTRMVSRLKLLPPGEQFPYQLSVWRMGDAIWVATQGEPYSLLQTSLRARFPETPIVICSIANGWGPSYLPPAELYELGIYQESVAVLAPGSLERVIAEAAGRIEQLLE